jgi:hypothetical protein
MIHSTVRRTSLILVFLFSALHPRPALAGQLLVEIQADDNHLTSTVTNLSGKPITAYVTKNSFWDSVISGESPIQSGAHITRDLGRIVASAVPYRVEVLGGIWADGESFGQAAVVQDILNVRKVLARDYEDAANFLQHGLDEHWSCDQYLQALDRIPDSHATYDMRSNLMVVKEMANHEKGLVHLVNTLLDNFIGKCARIRRAKPSLDTPPIS